MLDLVPTQPTFAAVDTDDHYADEAALQDTQRRAEVRRTKRRKLPLYGAGLTLFFR